MSGAGSVGIVDIFPCGIEEMERKKKTDVF